MMFAPCSAILAAALVLLAAPGFAQEAKPQNADLVGRAVAIDGDTLVLGGKRIRVFGIDAPEMKTPEGLPARDAMDRIIDGRELSCEQRDTDRYRRIVAVCKAGGTDISEAMLLAGQARHWRSFSAAAPEYPAYVAAETKARAAKLGIWSEKHGLWFFERIWNDAQGLATLFAGFLAIVGGGLAYRGAVKQARAMHDQTLAVAEREEQRRAEHRHALVQQLVTQFNFWLVRLVEARAYLESVNEQLLTFDGDVANALLSSGFVAPKPFCDWHELALLDGFAGFVASAYENGANIERGTAPTLMAIRDNRYSASDAEVQEWLDLTSIAIAKVSDTLRGLMGIALAKEIGPDSPEWHEREETVRQILLRRHKAHPGTA